MKKKSILFSFLIVFLFAATFVYGEPLSEFYLYDGVLFRCEAPYYIEGTLENQDYFTVTDYEGWAVDAYIIYSDSCYAMNAGDAEDIFLSFARSWNVEFFSREMLQETGEAYSLIYDKSRSDADAYIIYAGAAEDEGFFCYGFDLSPSPGGYARALILLSMPGLGSEVLQDVLQYFSLEFLEAAG